MPGAPSGSPPGSTHYPMTTTVATTTPSPALLKVCSGCRRRLPRTAEFFDSDDRGPINRCRQCVTGVPQPYVPPLPPKRCWKCTQAFPATLEYFHKDASRGSGLSPRCRQCTAEYQRKRAAENALANASPGGQGIPGDAIKVCWKCTKTFPATLEFFEQDTRRGSGLSPRCRRCVAEHPKRLPESEALERRRQRDAIRDAKPARRKARRLQQRRRRAAAKAKALTASVGSGD